MNADDRYDIIVRKVLQDSGAESSAKPVYDPPTDPELRKIYDELYELVDSEVNDSSRL